MYTPGPWKVNTIDLGSWAGRLGVQQDGGTGLWVAVAPSAGKEAEATMQLISAAPDLLSKMKEIVEAINLNAADMTPGIKNYLLHIANGAIKNTEQEAG